MEQLFGSKTRVKLLELFLRNPNREYYVREITRKVDEQINSVRRELANLLNIGVLKSDNRNNRLYYEVNQKYKHYQSLRAIFAGVAPEGEKSGVSADKALLQTIKGLGAVDLLIYLGTFTQDTDTNIDVMVVGDVNKTQVHNYIADLEIEEGRELRYVVMPTEEFKYRRSVNDRFITLVDGAKKTIVHDPHGIMSSVKSEPAKTTKKGK